eukprot:COSAG04_NODE_1017_length_8747_cov_9.470282_9_plen_366_part_01
MAAGAQVGLEGAFSFSARSLSDASRCSINAIPMQQPKRWESQHMDARSVDTVPCHEKLSVTVVKAERLVRLDPTHRDLRGTYVALRVHGGGFDEVQHTAINRAMSWEDKRYDFELTEWTDIRRAKLQLSLRAVWQGDGGADSETLIGECGLSLSGLSGERPGAVERRLRLGDGAGELVVRCELDRHMPRVLRSDSLHREASPRGRFLAQPGRGALEESERAAELADLSPRSYRRSPPYTASKQRHRARFSTPSRATRQAAPSPSLKTRYSPPRREHEHARGYCRRRSPQSRQAVAEPEPARRPARPSAAVSPRHAAVVRLLRAAVASRLRVIGEERKAKEGKEVHCRTVCVIFCREVRIWYSTGRE